LARSITFPAAFFQPFSVREAGFEFDRKGDAVRLAVEYA
jgi:hypothetical protein